MSGTVLITGASSGIGRATVKAFQQAGWKVAATMRRPEAESELPGLPNVSVLRLDVTDEASIRQAIRDTEHTLGPIDAVVNNAGYGLIGPFEASTPEQVERQFRTNVFGLMNVVREILPRMRERRRGTIINVASMGGRVTFPLYSVYHGTKWAVEGFTESLQYEVEPFGIRVKIIEPGPIRTDFFSRSIEIVRLAAYDAFVNRALPNLQKAGENGADPADTAAVILRAATDGSTRIRYQSNARSVLLLRRLFPDGAYMSVIKRAILK